ncbi:translesion DNA synthesis-associated protein ImuA [Alcaligenaceae bacterium]|nr:translesion DNA synthesis-associated protein ImuA [Alcaligenaceae bacterium]
MADSARLSRHPERIHPALWRATQLARPARAAVATGFPALDRELPGQGWPVGRLIELMPERPGCGELQLFRPALMRHFPERGIALVHPPHPPCIQAWANWQLAPERLLWIQPPSCADALWATEQVLRHNVCAAVFCWAGQIHMAGLRRLHLLAQQSDSLCIVLRPSTARRQASAAPLRLALQPCRRGMRLHIVKRQGGFSPAPVMLQLYAAQAASRHHESVDMPEMA